MARKHSMLLRWHSITLKTSHHAHPSHIRHCSLLSTCSWSNHQSCTQWNLQSKNSLKAPKACEQFMDNLYIHPLATIRFHTWHGTFPSLWCRLPCASQCKGSLCHPKQTVQPPYIQPSHNQPNGPVNILIKKSMASHLLIEKMRLVVSFLVHRNVCPSFTPLLNLVTHNLILGPPVRLATPLSMTLSWPKFEWNALRFWHVVQLDQG